MNVRVILAFLADYRKHLSHNIIDTFDDTIAANEVGACREVVYAESFVYGGCDLTAELKFVIGQKAGRASPEMDITVHQSSGSDFGCEFSCGNREHVRTAAKTICDEEDV